MADNTLRMVAELVNRVSGPAKNYLARHRQHRQGRTRHPKKALVSRACEFARIRCKPSGRKSVTIQTKTPLSGGLFVKTAGVTTAVMHQTVEGAQFAVHGRTM
jgi:hypothetical protein